MEFGRGEMLPDREVSLHVAYYMPQLAHLERQGNPTVSAPGVSARQVPTLTQYQCLAMEWTFTKVYMNAMNSKVKLYRKVYCCTVL
jgi:hypothetical protein